MTAEGLAPTIRRSDAADAGAAADLFLRCRHHAVPDIPPLAFPDHTVRAWLEGVVRQRQVWVERHGFVAQEWTDGRANQERAPDVRYAWGHG